MVTARAAEPGGAHPPRRSGPAEAAAPDGALAWAVGRRAGECREAWARHAGRSGASAAPEPIRHVMLHRAIRWQGRSAATASVHALDGAVTRVSLACGRAAAVLSLAACGGGGESVSGRAPGLGEIRELTGLSAPVETPEAQQERSLDIFPRADALLLSTMHGETGDAEVPAFRLLTQCSGARCTATDPASGTVDRIELVNTPLRHGAATAIGSKHGITLVSEASGHTGADHASLGAWMEHSSFATQNERQTGEEGTVDVWYGITVGDFAAAAPVGSATWLGLMAGTPVSGDARGERLVGDVALIYAFPSGGDGSGPSLDAAIGGIANIDRGTAHTVETVLFSDLAVGADGTFARGQAGARIQGGFFGPNHAEAAGIFERSGIVGAFGARRQQPRGPVAAARSAGAPGRSR